MYHDFPDENDAYLNDADGYYPQYLLGPSLVAAPVVAKMDGDPETGHFANQTIWLPWSESVELASGRVFGKGRWSMDAGLEDVPVFAEAGSVIPALPGRNFGLGAAMSLQDADTIELLVFLGANTTSGAGKIPPRPKSPLSAAAVLRGLIRVRAFV